MSLRFRSSKVQGHRFVAAAHGYAEAMLVLTSEASQAIERILKAPGVPDGAGLRIIPVGPGDEAEMSSELQVEVAEQPGEKDEVIETNGARVFVEDSLGGYLSDKMLDAEMVEERIRFSLAGQRG